MDLLTAALLALTLHLAGPPAAVWPLDPSPQVAHGFDPPTSAWGAGHRGADLRGHPGQRVRAAEPGTVTFTGRIAGRGIVVVDHGGTRTTYQPVRATVRAGAEVAAGTEIGRLEVFGSHCFPAACLHWGLIEGPDTYLDPLTLVGAGPVRLLPLTGPVPGPSGAGMSLPVGLAQPVGGHVGVDLGGRH